MEEARKIISQVGSRVVLICDFVYENEKIVDIIPKYFFSAFNDFSIRIQDEIN